MKKPLEAIQFDAIQDLQDSVDELNRKVDYIAKCLGYDVNDPIQAPIYYFNSAKSIINEEMNQCIDDNKSNILFLSFMTDKFFDKEETTKAKFLKQRFYGIGDYLSFVIAEFIRSEDYKNCGEDFQSFIKTTFRVRIENGNQN